MNSKFFLKLSLPLLFAVFTICTLMILLGRLTVFQPLDSYTAAGEGGINQNWVALNSVNAYRNDIWLKYVVIILITGIVMTGFFLGYVNIALLEPIRNLAKQAREHLAKRNVSVPREDGLDTLHSLFTELRIETPYPIENPKVLDDLEEKVRQRTKDLETARIRLETKLQEVSDLNELMIGREIKMIELKNEIAKLQGGKN